MRSQRLSHPERALADPFGGVALEFIAIAATIERANENDAVVEAAGVHLSLIHI